MLRGDYIINYNDPILITGANGLLGSRLIKTLLDYGFNNLRCFVSLSSNLHVLNRIIFFLLSLVSKGL